MAAICTVPVSPMRLEPSHKSEMVSQLIFGEYFEILEVGKIPWFKIRCLFDGYEGWCHDSHITSDHIDQFMKTKNILTADWVTNLEFNGINMMVPLGSSLYEWQDDDAPFGQHRVVYHGKGWDPSKAKRNADTLTELALRFLNTAYLWGGKSIFGIDCSGYTQTVFKFFDVHLLRDAYQQALQGETVGLLEESSCGDLAFFDNDDGEIVHVGILLNTHQIIHASGKVRMDGMDLEGIIHSENLKRTHHLKVIKRYF